MSFKYDIWRIAQAEIIEAFGYYEKLRPVLGSNFLKAVDEAVEVVRENPTAYQVVYQIVRRAPLKGFPYRILYYIEGDQVLIAGCVHTNRDPSSWQGRFN